MTRIRPLTMRSAAINAVASCAYFYEDPNIASTFPQGFNTSIKANDDLTISEVEFWDLQGTLPSTVTITWDSQSNVAAFVDQLEDIRVMGWNKFIDQWVDLGNTAFSGDLNSGEVTSVEFVPLDYAILTLGGNKGDTEPGVINMDSYLLSPNGDGVNDTLIIENLELSPNNTLSIYNRYGVLVYQMENYNNQFDGKSNVEMVVNQPEGLSAGVYFYIMKLEDLGEEHQGYLYIFND
jgi:gliding motility-associated-like protein